MYIIEISESKVNDLANTISKMLHYGGMAMECIEDMRSGARYDNEDMHSEERHYAHGARYCSEDMRDGTRYDMRGDARYGGEDFPYAQGARYGMRDDEWDEDYRLNERRGRSAITGRYVRR